ncbi:MAG: hypothetical protein AAF633_14150, partial [Chloroflexota bacterium]
MNELSTKLRRFLLKRSVIVITSILFVICAGAWTVNYTLRQTPEIRNPSPVLDTVRWLNVWSEKLFGD